MKTNNNHQKQSVQQLSAEQLNSVKAKFAAESKTFGSCIRNFVAVAETDSTAELLLSTICGYESAGIPAYIGMSVNQIKQAVKAAYPYTKDGVMLRKDGELFVPVEAFGFTIIKAAYLAKIGAKKRPTEIVQATDAQVEAAETKKAEKKATKAAEREAAKVAAQEQTDLLEALINSTSAEAAWSLILAERENRAKKAAEVK